MKRWLMALTASAALVAGCQPADPNIRSVKDRLEAGEMVEFKENGYRRPGCPSKAPDWTDVGVDEKTRERVVLRTQTTFLQPGRTTCIRVGSTLAVKQGRKDTSGTRAQVVKLGLVKLDNLTQGQLQNGFYASSDEFNRLKAVYKGILKPKHDGVVTVVYIRYLGGSAVDEKAIKEQAEAQAHGDGFTATQKDGDTISGGCKNAWTSLVVPQEFQADVLSGKLRSWYRLGDLNCMPQGQVSGVAAGPTDPAAGQVKVKQIKKFRAAHLADQVNPKYFDVSQEQWAVIWPLIKNDKKLGEWITVTDFEPVAAFQPFFSQGGTP